LLHFQDYTSTTIPLNRAERWRPLTVRPALDITWLVDRLDRPRTSGRDGDMRSVSRIVTWSKVGE
jgi:hypothetical protein